MAVLPLLSQTLRSSVTATRSLPSSMRALSLASSLAHMQSRPTTALPAQQLQQTRCLSQTILSHPHRCTNSCCSRPTLATRGQSGAGSEVKGFQAQQTRGMKVQSAVKKRCEHCKVSFAAGRALGLNWGTALVV